MRKLSTNEKIGVAAATAAVVGLGVALWPKSSAATSTGGAGPSPTSPFLVTLPKGPAPLGNAGAIDLIADKSGNALISVDSRHPTPVLTHRTSDVIQPGATLQQIASVANGPKAAANGPVVAVMSVGWNSSPSGDEGAYVRQIEQKFKAMYDRVIWIASAGMPQKSLDAIVGNATEYVALVTHDATPQGLHSILYGSGPNALGTP